MILRFLIGKCKPYTLELAKVFPCDTDEEKRLFDPMRRAYLEARYNDKFVVTKADIDALVPKIELLRAHRRKSLQRTDRRIWKSDLATAQAGIEPILRFWIVLAALFVVANFFYYICLFIILTLIMDSGFNSIKDIFDSLIVAASLILSLMSLKKSNLGLLLAKVNLLKHWKSTTK